jgi:type IV pilus assembly protein PilO
MASLYFNRLPWYGQVGAFAAIAIAAVAAFWSFYAVPAQATIAERQAQLAATRADIARGQRTAANLPAFEQEVAGLEANLEERRKQLPEEQDVADLLRRVQGMATESRLAIRGFTPRAVTRQQLHAEWPIGLELEGTYHDLGAFLERVSKFPRIINVGNIKISAREGQPGGTITAECTATTFVLIDPKAAPDPKKPVRRAARAS